MHDATDTLCKTKKYDKLLLSVYDGESGEITVLELATFTIPMRGNTSKLDGALYCAVLKKFFGEQYDDLRSHIIWAPISSDAATPAKASSYSLLEAIGFKPTDARQMINLCELHHHCTGMKHACETFGNRETFDRGLHVLNLLHGLWWWRKHYGDPKAFHDLWNAANPYSLVPTAFEEPKMLAWESFLKASVSTLANLDGWMNLLKHCISKPESEANTAWNRTQARQRFEQLSSPSLIFDLHILADVHLFYFNPTFESCRGPGSAHLKQIPGFTSLEICQRHVDSGARIRHMLDSLAKIINGYHSSSELSTESGLWCANMITFLRDEPSFTPAVVLDRLQAVAGFVDRLYQNCLSYHGAFRVLAPFAFTGITGMADEKPTQLARDVATFIICLMIEIGVQQRLNRPQDQLLQAEEDDRIRRNCYTVGDHGPHLQLDEVCRPAEMGDFYSGTMDDHFPYFEMRESAESDFVSITFHSLNRFSSLFPTGDVTIHSVRGPVILFFLRQADLDGCAEQTLYDQLTGKLPLIKSSSQRPPSEVGSSSHELLSDGTAFAGVIAIGQGTSYFSREQCESLWLLFGWFRPSASNTLILESLMGKTCLKYNKQGAVGLAAASFMATNQLKPSTAAGKAAGTNNPANKNALDSRLQIQAFLETCLSITTQVRDNTNTDKNTDCVAIDTLYDQITGRTSAARATSKGDIAARADASEHCRGSSVRVTAVFKKESEKMLDGSKNEAGFFCCVCEKQAVFVHETVGERKKKVQQVPFLRKCRTCDRCWHDKCMSGIGVLPFPMYGLSCSCGNFQPDSKTSQLHTMVWFTERRRWCAAANQVPEVSSIPTDSAAVGAAVVHFDDGAAEEDGMQDGTADNDLMTVDPLAPPATPAVGKGKGKRAQTPTNSERPTPETVSHRAGPPLRSDSPIFSTMLRRRTRGSAGDSGNTAPKAKTKFL